MNQNNDYRHPCFNVAAREKCARIHLPVAQGCNIQCNYCNRKTDCVNESRPGVTSKVIEPEEGLELVGKTMKKIPGLSVVGIAGPGEPLASDKTFETLELINKHFNSLQLCLSTNGLYLNQSLSKIKSLNVNFVTVTINAVSSEVGTKIYSWVNYNGKMYKGEEAFGILNDQQLTGLNALVSSKIATKVNIVVIPGINDSHIHEIVAKVAKTGVNICNIVPLIPVQDTPFEKIPRPSANYIAGLRHSFSAIVPQMHHCNQCRADAVGYLEKGPPTSCINVSQDKRKIRVAVASQSGLLIDQHFGHVSSFLIYDVVGEDVIFLGRREVNKFCTSMDDEDEDQKIIETHKVIQDCNFLLSQRIGRFPALELEKRGVVVIETLGFISDAIKKLACGIPVGRRWKEEAIG